MKLDLYKFDHYRKHLESMIKAHAAEYGYKSKLAKAAGCRNSFISQVLSGSYDFSLDHAIGLSKFWKFGEAEREYYLALVGLAKAATAPLREHYRETLSRLRKDQERTILRGPAQEVPDQAKTAFYSSWQHIAVWVALELDQFDVSRVAKRLGVDAKLAKRSVEILIDAGLVQSKDGKLSYAGGNLVVPPQSPFEEMHVSNWTQRAALDVRRREQALESLHKCWLFTLSQQDYARLREMLLEFIQTTATITRSSKIPTELICLNLHLFSV